jgi:curved DNA-binding protein CbpA
MGDDTLPEQQQEPASPIGQERLHAWDEVLDDATYYEILGVLDIADPDAIRRAFHDFSLAFHPDAQPRGDEEARAIALRIFRRGVEAYRALSVPEQRAAYDLALAKGQVRLGEGPSTRVEDRGPGAARSLDELCRSAGAKLYAKRAEDLITAGDLRAATHELLRALRAEDGDNPELAERIAALTTLSRLSSPPSEGL